MSPLLSWIKKYLFNVTALGLIVVLILAFSGEYTVQQSVGYYHTIDSLRAELEANRDTMLYYRDLNARLSSDPELMEQIVREQWGMKRANEDVFVFVETPSQQ